MHEPTDDTPGAARYCLRISKALKHMVWKQIKIANLQMKSRYGIREWALEAILEKLERYSHDPSLASQASLSFPIPPEILQEVEKQVETLKTFQGSGSKQQWIEDAFIEKLDRDASRIQELLQHST